MVFNNYTPIKSLNFMNAIFNVRSKDGQIISSFHFTFCERSKEKLQLDLETFYLAYGKEIPDANIEMRIDDVSPFSLQDMLDKKAHIHKGNDKKWYICYPKKLTMSQAIAMAIHWSMMTAFHMQCQADVSFFESFDRWMTKKRDSVKEANVTKKVNAFDEFALWVHDSKGWKVEIIENKVEIMKSKIDTFISAYSQELMNVLILNN